MKIAIPTNDGILMAGSFEESKGFLILDIQLGHIQKEELVWKSNGNRLTHPVDDITLISGCSSVITENISEKNTAGLSAKGISLVRSHEQIITNTIINYLENVAGKTADFCCCP